MDEKKLYNFLYEMYKSQKIIEIELKKNKTKNDKGLLFALKNEIYPVLDLKHEIIDKEIINEFENLFVIKKDFIDKVFEQIDNSYLNRDYKTFNYWEDIFGKDKQSELILVFEYLFIEKSFNNDFKKTLIDHYNNPDDANYLLQYLVYPEEEK